MLIKMKKKGSGSSWELSHSRTRRGNIQDKLE
jgi:hypothetical protein